MKARRANRSDGRGGARWGVRVLAALLLLLFASLQFSLWGGDGVARWYKLRESNERERAVNETLKTQNQALMREVRDVKTGVSALEEKAREDLGMVKRGETFVRVIERAPETPREQQ